MSTLSALLTEREIVQSRISRDAEILATIDKLAELLRLTLPPVLTLANVAVDSNDCLSEKELFGFLGGGRYSGLIQKVATEKKVHYSYVSKIAHGRLVSPGRTNWQSKRTNDMKASVLTMLRAEMKRVDDDLLNAAATPTVIPGRDARLPARESFYAGQRNSGVARIAAKNCNLTVEAVNKVIRGASTSKRIVEAILDVISKQETVSGGTL